MPDRLNYHQRCEVKIVRKAACEKGKEEHQSFSLLSSTQNELSSKMMQNTSTHFLSWHLKVNWPIHWIFRCYCWFLHEAEAGKMHCIKVRLFYDSFRLCVLKSVLPICDTMVVCQLFISLVLLLFIIESWIKLYLLIILRLHVLVWPLLAFFDVGDQANPNCLLWWSCRDWMPT